MVKQRGYTLIELMIVLAIMGLTIAVLVPGADTVNKADQLSNETRELANGFKQAQTESYSVATGTNGGSGCPANAQGHVFWRGDVLEVDAVAEKINIFLLCGNDLSAFTGSNSETVGITGKQPYTGTLINTDFANSTGLTIVKVDYSCEPLSAAPCGGTVQSCTNASASCQVSLAFLAPEGHIFNYPGVQNPSPGDNTPYTQQAKVLIYVKDTAIPNLTGIVTIDAADGTIDSSVQ